MSTEAFPSSPLDFAQSHLFQRTFSEGMGLVEETAEFLEGRGRDLSKDLSRDGALAYAAESMRLTTRLMQIASWLLVHRAVREGEMTPEQARAERYRLVVEDDRDDADAPFSDELPAALLELVRRCDLIYSRLVRLDERLNNEGARDEPAVNPVALQLAQLQSALAAGST